MKTHLSARKPDREIVQCQVAETHHPYKMRYSVKLEASISSSECSEKLFDRLRRYYIPRRLDHNQQYPNRHWIPTAVNVYQYPLKSDTAFEKPYKP